MLSLYLCMEGKNSPLSGAISYCMPFNLKHNVSFFKQNLFGFFDFAMGFIYSMVLKYELLPDLKNHIEPEQYNFICEGLQKHRLSLMDLDQNVMIPFMTKSLDLDSYYSATSSWG